MGEIALPFLLHIECCVPSSSTCLLSSSSRSSFHLFFDRLLNRGPEFRHLMIMFLFLLFALEWSLLWIQRSILCMAVVLFRCNFRVLTSRWCSNKRNSVMIINQVAVFSRCVITTSACKRIFRGCI